MNELKIDIWLWTCGHFSCRWKKYHQYHEKHTAPFNKEVLFKIIKLQNFIMIQICQKSSQPFFLSLIIFLKITLARQMTSKIPFLFTQIHLSLPNECNHKWNNLPAATRTKEDENYVGLSTKDVLPAVIPVKRTRAVRSST